ncbi:MAG: hypothetical protein QME96_12435 [Myxococcota bacterium]|nr:hypothetical protein [Myxococcota bacterium]
MNPACATRLIALAVACAVPPACRKARRIEDAAAPPGTAAVVEAYAPADAGEIRNCRAALVRQWGLAVRSAEGTGTREDVIRLAQLKLCAEHGIVEADCTADLFDGNLEGCVGDPRPEEPADPGLARTAAAVGAAAASAHADAGDAEAADPEAAAPGGSADPAGEIVL